MLQHNSFRTARSSRAIFSLALVFISFAGAGCGRQQGADAATAPLQWFVASSVRDAAGELRDLFVEETGIDVELTVGSSSVLANQIMQGAQADLFLSANQLWADEVAERLGARVAGRCDLLRNRLVIVRPTSNQQRLQPDDLLQTEFSEIALANPDSVPAGVYAKQAMQKLGLWADLQHKLIPAENVRSALQYVESGHAPIGIVYASDAMASDQVVAVCEFDRALHDPIVYPLLRMANTPGRTRDVSSLFDFLLSDRAASLFSRHGFEPMDRHNKIAIRRLAGLFERSRAF